MEAGIDPAAATYDDPMGGYNQGQLYDADGLPSWWPLDCQLTGFGCGYGATPGQSPGVVAEAGGLKAELYDPDRLLDATGPRGRLLRAGVPVRVMAREGTGYGSGPYGGGPYGGTTAESVVWSGTVDSWPHDLRTGEGSMSATDGVAVVAPVPVVGLARPAERTPDRLAALLAVHPNPPLFVPAGVGRMLAPATLEGDLWQCMKSVVDTDQSWLWVAPDGAVRWRGRGYEPPETVLVDCPGPEPWDAVYTDLDTDADDSQLVNVVTVRRVQPAPQPAPLVVGHSGSIAAHGPESLSNTALQLATDADVEQWAADVLALRAYPIHRPTEVVLSVDPRLWWADRTMDAVMRLGVTSLLRVRLTTRGPVQEWLAVVASIQHDVTPTSWETRIGLGMVREAGVGGYDGERYDSAVYDHNPVARVVGRDMRGLVHA
jgi:hypothetical protein